MENRGLHLAYISVGSNMGNRIENCEKGIKLLNDQDFISVLIRSPFYQTEPVDYIEQDWFINGVVQVETSLEPVSLLKTVKGIEQQVGRKSSDIRFGPRILDMDLLLYDSSVFQHSGLEIPHPRMHKRCFVLKPLCDIDPNIVHPVLGQTIQNLLDRIDQEGQEVIQYSCGD
ncbi:MAG: 2-amino-4-hydroxy-6-hydroxymethyldihydropteridine diphosphokinase [Desulfobacterium sp.]|nr:2-amino-4-hydroxy-6-hydroxymethyldihydropteridine diphosphokinase [Desulfobacterium sp.]